MYTPPCNPRTRPPPPTTNFLATSAPPNSARKGQRKRLSPRGERDGHAIGVGTPAQPRLPCRACPAAPALPRLPRSSVPRGSRDEIEAHVSRPKAGAPRAASHESLATPSLPWEHRSRLTDAVPEKSCRTNKPKSASWPSRTATPTPDHTHLCCPSVTASAFKSPSTFSNRKL
eukprot:4233490-Pleurochrysis_carterae.AAC.1